MLISVENYFLDYFIYYKESINNRPIKSIDKNKAMVESKQKLLNILNRTDLFQRFVSS